MTVVRNIGLGLVAAMLVGVLDGGISRVLMRGVALATNEVTEFSWGATLGIMLIFAITAAPLAVTAELTVRSGPRLTAGVVGTAILGFFSVNIGLQEVTNADGLDAQHWAALIACVVALAAIVVLQPWVVLRLVRRGRARAVLPQPVP
jgi:hypothetical protein